jgi:hypothetical protein
LVTRTSSCSWFVFRHSQSTPRTSARSYTSPPPLRLILIDVRDHAASTRGHHRLRLVAEFPVHLFIVSRDPQKLAFANDRSATAAELNSGGLKP